MLLMRKRIIKFNVRRVMDNEGVTSVSELWRMLISSGMYEKDEQPSYYAIYRIVTGTNVLANLDLYVAIATLLDVPFSEMYEEYDEVYTLDGTLVRTEPVLDKRREV